MNSIRWGIIGPGAIAHNFADGLNEAKCGHLIAISGRNPKRLSAFAENYKIPQDKLYGDYKALLDDRDVDAVYVSTPHPSHAQIAVDAMRAGKPVMVEKPAGMCAAEVQALVEVARQQDVLLIEAYMYRCHPQIARAIEIVRSGEIGKVEHIRSTFGFNAPFDPQSRLYNPDLGGGAILDVGGYPISFALLFASVALGQSIAEPIEFRGAGHVGPSGVDEVAHAISTFDGGLIAEAGIAINRPMDNRASISGTLGSIEFGDPWVPGRNAGPSDANLTVTIGQDQRIEKIKDPRHLFAFEAELASQAVASNAKEAPFPAMTPEHSIATNKLLDRWRNDVGYETFNARTQGYRKLRGLVSAGVPKIGKVELDGFEKPISKLIMGCDNRDNLADGALVWDTFLEAGGNCFDTAFVYGNGHHEKVLGDWIKATGVEKEISVIVKGGHSPYCTPRNLRTQLEISLERLGLARAPIYIMHRDNLTVPVREFVDALNELRAEGLIGTFGGSNWTIERLQEANQYASTHGLEPLRILNNNLSLAAMERPVWPGCLSAHSKNTRSFLNENNMVHIAWSSQARGFFLPADLRNRLPFEFGPDANFGSAANEERRNRAAEIAKERGVETFNVATAWVLCQAFASLAVIGPRSPGEIISTLPALVVELSENEVRWLNLETDAR